MLHHRAGDVQFSHPRYQVPRTLSLHLPFLLLLSSIPVFSLCHSHFPPSLFKLILALLNLQTLEYSRSVLDNILQAILMKQYDSDLVTNPSQTDVFIVR
jgi:hypothetical protein